MYILFHLSIYFYWMLFHRTLCDFGILELGKTIFCIWSCFFFNFFSFIWKLLFLCWFKRVPHLRGAKWRQKYFEHTPKRREVDYRLKDSLERFCGDNASKTYELWFYKRHCSQRWQKILVWDQTRVLCISNTANLYQ